MAAEGPLAAVQQLLHSQRTLCGCPTAVQQLLHMATPTEFGWSVILLLVVIPRKKYPDHPTSHGAEKTEKKEKGGSEMMPNQCSIRALRRINAGNKIFSVLTDLSLQARQTNHFGHR